MRIFAEHPGAKRLLWIVGFVSLAIIAYWPAFFSERVWDDHFLVGSNPFFRSPHLAAEAFRHWLYPFEVTSYFRPVQNLSYMVDYWFWEENLFGYHLTNVLLHATAALLLATLIRRIANTLAPEQRTTNEWLALATGLVWLLHPIHHAAVAYISGRADSLAAIFALVAWLSAERAMQSQRNLKRAGWSAAAGVCCGLALFSKEIAITWIGLFVLYQFLWSPNSNMKVRISCSLSALGIVACYFLYRHNLPQLTELQPIAQVVPIEQRLVNCLRALGDYISITLVPWNLHMERQLHAPTESLKHASEWLYLHSRILLPLGIAGLVCMTLACVLGKQRRLAAFAVTWFLVGFLPISNVFPLNAPVAEHWIYMPSAGLIFLLLTWCSSLLEHRPAAKIGLVASVLAALTLLTHEQSRTWVTEEQMFRTAIARGGDTLRARSNLARILDAKGRREEAIEILRVALARKPKHPALNLQLAAILQREHQEAEALVIFQRVSDSAAGNTRRPPKPWAPESQRVEMLLIEKRYKDAEFAVQEALSHWPSVWELIRLQVLLLEQAGKDQEAVNALQDYIAENWWHREAVILLAQYLAKQERYDESANFYGLAAKLDVHDPQPWAQTALIRARQGRLPEALAAQRKAVAIRPKSRDQRQRLAQLYLAMGDETEALIEQQTAEALAPEAR